MTSSPTPEKTIAYALIGMTAVTGLVDAVSFLSLGRVFTANMTGNVVVLAFAAARAGAIAGALARGARCIPRGLDHRWVAHVKG